MRFRHIEPLRIVACAFAWALAIVLAPARAVIGNPITLIYSWAFPVGLLAFFWRADRELREGGNLTLVIIGLFWLFYVALTATVVCVRRRAAGWSLFALLCVCLMANVAGCHQVWRENSIGSLAFTRGQRMREDTAIQNDGLSKFAPARQIASRYHDVDHYLTDGGNSRCIWNTVAFFDGRFELRLCIPVRIDYSALTVTQTGEPKFFLWVLKRVTVPPPQKGGASADIESERKFGSDEWKKFVSSDYDLTALGIPRDAIHPIEHFQEYVRAARRSRVATE